MIRAEIPVIVSGSSESQWPPQHPQRTVDEFWRSFNTKTPGRGRSGAHLGWQQQQQQRSRSSKSPRNKAANRG